MKVALSSSKNKMHMEPNKLIMQYHRHNAVCSSTILPCWHISVYSTKMGHVSYTFTIIGHLLSAPRGIKQIRSLQSFCQHNSIQITAIWFTLVYNTIWATFFIIIILSSYGTFIYLCIHVDYRQLLKRWPMIITSSAPQRMLQLCQCFHQSS